MKIKNFIIIALVIISGFSFYQYFALNDRQKKLAAELKHINASFNKEKAQIEQEHQADIARLDGALSSLPGPPTADTVAASLLKARNAELVNWIAEKLISDSQYVDKLRGPKGDTPKPPSAENIAAQLLSDGAYSVSTAVANLLMDNPKFQEQVRGKTGPAGKSTSAEAAANYIITYYGKALFDSLEQEFWKQRKSFILQDPGLIADSAEAVYLTYGKSLQGRKGQDAQTPSIEEIARQLSSDYEFAQLVADFIE